jgi:hypothetical protein
MTGLSIHQRRSLLLFTVGSSYLPQNERKGHLLCNTRIEPNALTAVRVISPIPLRRVIRPTNPGQSDQPLTPALQDLGIKYVEFEDGSTWRHPEWNSTVLLTREAIRKLGKGKCATL